MGGDEINVGCWNWSNSTHTSPIRLWKEAHDYTWPQVIQLFYRTVWNRTVGAAEKSTGEPHEPREPREPREQGISKVVTWEDLYLNRTTGKFDFTSPYVPFSNKEAIIEVWTNTKYLNEVVQAGYDGIYAAGWYLDRQQPVDGVVAWEWLDTMWQMYDIDPEVDVVDQGSGNSNGSNGSNVSNGSNGRVGQVLGGEASMWSEQVNRLTLDGRMWPRACTIGERLWSTRTTTNHAYAAHRLREHRCRMVEWWGIGAGPFWSDRCVGHGKEVGASD